MVIAVFMGMSKLNQKMSNVISLTFPSILWRLKVDIISGWIKSIRIRITQLCSLYPVERWLICTCLCAMEKLLVIVSMGYGFNDFIGMAIAAWEGNFQ